MGVTRVCASVKTQPSARLRCVHVPACQCRLDDTHTSPFKTSSQGISDCSLHLWESRVAGGRGREPRHETRPICKRCRRVWFPWINSATASGRFTGNYLQSLIMLPGEIVNNSMPGMNFFLNVTGRRLRVRGPRGRTSRGLAEARPGSFHSEKPAAAGGGQAAAPLRGEVASRSRVPLTRAHSSARSRVRFARSAPRVR